MDDQDAISINAYRQSEYPTLPYEGWIKVCSNRNCRTITSRFVYAKYRKRTFKFYFCHTCTKNLDINKYIKAYYIEKMQYAIKKNKKLTYI